MATENDQGGDGQAGRKPEVIAPGVGLGVVGATVVAMFVGLAHIIDLTAELAQLATEALREKAAVTTSGNSAEP